MARIAKVLRARSIGAVQMNPERRGRAAQQTGAVSRNPCRSGSSRRLSSRAIGADPEIGIPMIGS